jgi:sulfur carrier protein ThiS
MMKVTVRLFGTLSQKFPGYDPVKGLEVEIPDGARVKDLLAHLGISETMGGVATVKGMILRLEDPLKDGASVHLLQAVYGG